MRTEWVGGVVCHVNPEASGLATEKDLGRLTGFSEVCVYARHVQAHTEIRGGRWVSYRTQDEL